MNRLFLIAFILPGSALALEATEPQLVRMLDGRVVNCKETHEIGKVTFLPKVKSVSVDENTLDASFDLDFLSCVSREEKLGLEPRLPLAPREHKDESGNLVRIEYRSADFLIGDANFGSSVVIPLEDKASQGITARVDLDKVLTVEQRRQLGEGTPVRARMSLLARRIATMVKNGESSPLGLRILGSFTFFVTIKP